MYYRKLLIYFLVLPEEICKKVGIYATERESDGINLIQMNPNQVT